MPNTHHEKITMTLISDTEDDDDDDEKFKEKFKNVLDEVHPVNYLY